ncbi:MAG: tRNA dihydrouridine synthase DusB [Acidobacteria bacterium]|nr:tRNA dihydrouridine synthase DusB [Acidobacteriota bacterium]
MRIGSVDLQSPLVVAPMAGMTDTAFRRLVKRQGGCGLVVTEMVSSEGLVRGIDRTLEYAEYTEEERPVSIQIFGGDPARMAEAARIVEGMGADIVDVNMGCPVPKIAKHDAGCSLMREPAHAAAIVAEMVKAVHIPVTVKMRKGWDAAEVNAPEVARRVADAGAAAITIHGRTAKQSYSGDADWDFVADVAGALPIPVFGSGDCVDAQQILDRLARGVSGVFVGRGVLRNPWILAQARDLLAGRPARIVTDEERGRFLLDYIELLLHERVHEADGFRHVAPGHGSRIALSNQVASSNQVALLNMRGQPGCFELIPRHDRWVINKLRALCSWYTKGCQGGAQLRTAINSAESLPGLRAIIEDFFSSGMRPVRQEMVAAAD